MRWQAKSAQPRRAKRLAIAALALAAIVGPLSARADIAVQQTKTGADKPHRIITLTPHVTEMVFAAGGGEHIVGTVTASDFPPAANAIPRVGDGITANQERIIMLRPTALIGWLRSGLALQLEPLAERMGAQMLYSRPLTLRDIPADIRRIGQLLDSATTANEAATHLEARINALENQYAQRAPVNVFIEVGSKPLYTIGDDPLLNDALRICGATNLYASTGIPAPRVSVESVLVQNPQLIIATGHPGSAPDEIRHRWASYGLPAALNGHIHIANPDALYRPGPRLIDAAEALCPAVDAVRTTHSPKHHPPPKP
ncbi:cobalamin-binding protein [Achromobacter sp. F4_2707]|uniref:cobalamin-binding protein n=1 Tax=Achromobacter sp. F4_2707 TaxID=3114286 RepID=UPI0039C6A35A